MTFPKVEAPSKTLGSIRAAAAKGGTDSTQCHTLHPRVRCLCFCSCWCACSSSGSCLCLCVFAWSSLVLYLCFSVSACGRGRAVVRACVGRFAGCFVSVVSTHVHSAFVALAPPCA